MFLDSSFGYLPNLNDLSQEHYYRGRQLSILSYLPDLLRVVGNYYRNVKQEH